MVQARPVREYFGERDLDSVLREHHAESVPKLREKGFTFVGKVSVKKSGALFSALEVAFPGQKFETVLNPNKGELGIEIYAQSLSKDFRNFLRDLVGVPAKTN